MEIFKQYPPPWGVLSDRANGTFEVVAFGPSEEYAPTIVVRGIASRELAALIAAAPNCFELVCEVLDGDGGEGWRENELVIAAKLRRVFGSMCVESVPPPSVQPADLGTPIESAPNEEEDKPKNAAESVKCPHCGERGRVREVGIPGPLSRLATRWGCLNLECEQTFYSVPCVTCKARGCRFCKDGYDVFPSLSEFVNEF